jgi:hypothetical protein
MFKILAVICTLGGDCSSFISEDQATHATLRGCEQKAERLATDLMQFADQDPQFAVMQVGCVSSDYVLD